MFITYQYELRIKKKKADEGLQEQSPPVRSNPAQSTLLPLQNLRLYVVKWQKESFCEAYLQC